MGGLDGFDQWLEHDPAMDYDPVEDATKLVSEVRWALTNWDTKPGVWGRHIFHLIATIEELCEYIEANT